MWRLRSRGVEAWPLVERLLPSRAWPTLSVRTMSERARLRGSDMAAADKPRIVRNHSTILDGLPDVLAYLERHALGKISSIVPGRMFTARSSREHFAITVASATATGFRLTCRRGQSVQEVFLVTAAIPATELQTLLDQAIEACIETRHISRVKAARLRQLEEEAARLEAIEQAETAHRVRARARAVRNGAWSSSERQRMAPSPRHLADSGINRVGGAASPLVAGTDPIR